MNKLGALIRAGLKSNFGLAVLKHRITKEKKDRWVIPFFALAGLGVLPVYVDFVKFLKAIILMLKAMGQEHAVLTGGILAGQFVILVFGIYYVLSAFYFSRDMEMLVPLPVRPSGVLVSKFAVILVNEYITVAGIILPFIITFGVVGREGIGFWVNAAIVYLSLPVMPLALISVPLVIMMRFVNLSRKKDILIVVGSILLLSLALSINFLAQKADSARVGPQEIVRFFVSPDSLMHRIGAGFPPCIWAAKAIAGGFSLGGLANLAIFLTATLVVFGAMIAVGERLFYRGVIGLSELGIRKQKLSREEMSRRVSSGRGAVSAIFIREWRIINRTPVFLLNCTLAVVMIPAVLLLMSKPGASPFGGMVAASIASGPQLAPILLMAMAMTICGCFNSTASSAFSREGPQFWISRMIPVSPRCQVTAKFLHSYCVCMLGVIAAVVAIAFRFPFKAGLTAAAMVLAMAASIVLTDVGMIIDLARPLLDWTNPQKAVKQNLNVLFATMVDIGILTGIYWVVKSLVKTGTSCALVLSVLLGFLLLLAWISHISLLKLADKRYREIET